MSDYSSKGQPDIITVLHPALCSTAFAIGISIAKAELMAMGVRPIAIISASDRHNLRKAARDKDVIKHPEVEPRVVGRYDSASASDMISG